MNFPLRDTSLSQASQGFYSQSHSYDDVFFFAAIREYLRLSVYKAQKFTSYSPRSWEVQERGSIWSRDFMLYYHASGIHMAKEENRPNLSSGACYCGDGLSSLTVMGLLWLKHVFTYCCSRSRSLTWVLKGTFQPKQFIEKNHKTPGENKPPWRRYLREVATTFKSYRVKSQNKINRREQKNQAL